MKVTVKKVTKNIASKKIVNKEESRFNEADKSVIKNIMVGVLKQERANTQDLFKQERAYSDKKFKDERAHSDNNFKVERKQAERDIESLAVMVLNAIRADGEQTRKEADDRFLAMVEHKDDNAKIYKDINSDIYSKIKLTNIRVDSLDLRVSELENA